jgi:hypothetical protein
VTSLQFANTFELPYGLNISLKYFIFHNRLTVIKQVAAFASSWVPSLRPLPTRPLKSSLVEMSDDDDFMQESDPEQ